MLPYLYTLLTYRCKLLKDKPTTLAKIRSIADYQLGKGAGSALFPDKINVTFSRRTGRIRHIYLESELLATLRPTDGMFSLTIAGAKRLLKGVNPPRLWVKVSTDAAPFVAEGKSVFAKHVISADKEIRPQEEVTVLDEQDKVLAVGKAVLTGKEMTAFKRGIAVRVRKGTAEK
jgi:predicted RNA-binding protein (TIGR00451 family)